MTALNHRAEMAVIGASLRDPTALRIAIEALPYATLFDRHDHRAIWRKVLALYGAGTPVDFVTLAEALGDELADIGGGDYLAELSANTPSSANASNYAALVLEAAERRRLAAELHRALDEIESGDPAAILERLRASTHRPTTSGAALISAADILATARAPEYAIHGILEVNTLAALVGPWGAGKSLITMDWCNRIPHGIPVHGRKVKQGPVVIIAGEGHGGIGRRLAAWQAHHKHPVSPLLSYTRRSVSIREAASVRALHDALASTADKDGAPVLIVIDTLSRNFGPGDENSNSDMASFVEAVDRWLREPFGAAVLILHHPGHLDKTRGRGASALPGAVDVEYLLDTDPAGVIRMTAPNKRPRDFRASDALCWKMVPVPLVLDGQHVEAVTVDEVGVEDFVEQADTKGMRENQTAMLELLHAEFDKRRCTLIESGHDPEQARVHCDDWRKLGIEARAIKDHRNTFYKLRDSLVKRRLITLENGFVELVAQP